MVAVEDIPHVKNSHSRKDIVQLCRFWPELGKIRISKTSIEWKRYLNPQSSTFPGTFFTIRFRLVTST